MAGWQWPREVFNGGGAWDREQGRCEACGCADGGPYCWVIFLSDATTRFRRDGSWVRFEFGVRVDHARDGCLSPCFRSKEIVKIAKWP